MTVWSDKLVEKTRAVICDYEFVPLGEVVHFKHRDSKYGYISVLNLLAGRLSMVDKRTHIETLYADADVLIADGWVIERPECA